MEDHHYGQKENITGPDIFDKPIDRTKSRQQAEQRFRGPETDIREKLEQLPPLSKKTKRNIGIAGAVALVLTGVIWAGGSFFGPKKTAENYVEAVLQGDWKSVYENLELPQGKLLGKEQFLAVTHERELVEVTNLKLEEQDGYGGSDSRFLKEYTAEYSVKGDSSVRSMELTLSRQKEKKMLFFSKWCVIPEGLIVSNYTIKAPVGYKVEMDGTALTPEEQPELEESGYDVYAETVFAGDHVITASADSREQEEFPCYISTDESYYEVPKLSISKKTVEQMQETVRKFMGDVYGEVLNQSGPSEKYLDYWAVNNGNKETAAIARENADALYRKLEEDFAYTNGYESVQFTGMNFSNYYSEVTDEYSDEYGGSYVNLHVSYNYDYTYTGTSLSYDQQTTAEDRSESGSSDSYMTFIMEDGQWKIYSADLYSIY